MPTRGLSYLEPGEELAIKDRTRAGASIAEIVREFGIPERIARRAMRIPKQESVDLGARLAGVIATRARQNGQTPGALARDILRAGLGLPGRRR